MNEPRTLRELLIRAGLGDVFPADSPHKIKNSATIAGVPLDAPLIGFPCQTCGGDGWDSMGGDCPDCHDQPRYAIVDPKAWVAAKLAATERRHAVIDEGATEARWDWDSCLTAALGCIIPNLRRAKEVGRYTLLPGDEPIACLMPINAPDGAGTAPVIEENALVAILDEEDA